MPSFTQRSCNDTWAISMTTGKNLFNNSDLNMHLNSKKIATAVDLCKLYDYFCNI